MELHDVKRSLISMLTKQGITIDVFPVLQFVRKKKKSEVKGTKAMKDKDRIATMVCISVVGTSF